MSFVPPSVASSWPFPNYVNPVTRSTTAYFTLTSIFLFLATTAVSARLYARIFIRRWFGLDDLFICLAYTATLGVFISVAVGTAKYEWERHLYDASLAVIRPSVSILYASSMLWSFSSTFTRLSLLSLYYRLLDHIHMKRYRWILHIVVFCHVSFLIAYIITLSLSCIPARAWWAIPAIPSKCINVGRFFVSIASLNTSMEFILAILPIPLVFDLQMENRQRWSIISLLSLGFLVSIVGCVRTFYVWKAFVLTYDTSWWSEEHWICSEVENDVALICACAPALQPLVKRILGTGIEDRPDRMDNVVSASKVSFASTHVRGKASVLPSMNSTLVCFDLEGIADDGMGYTVSITTGHGAQFMKGKSRRSSQPTNRRSVLAAMSMSWMGRKYRGGQSSKAADYEKRMRILTRRSVEVRESYEMQRSTSKEGIEDFPTWSEKNMDMDTERTAAEQLSVLETPTRAVTKPGTAIGKSVEQGVREDPDMPKIPEKSRTSPASRHPLTPPWRKMPTPMSSLLPPSTRPFSPVTRPLNSSQWWASPQSQRSTASTVSEDETWMHDMLTTIGEIRGQYEDESMFARDGSQESLSVVQR